VLNSNCSAVVNGRLGTLRILLIIESRTSAILFGATLKGKASGAKWEVEFAYDGLESRGETTDPPSSVLLVDLISENVQLVELL